MSNSDIQYCNWTFWECLKPSELWAVGRDCQGGREEDVSIKLRRGDNRNWKAYKSSLQSRPQFHSPLESSKCPNCLKYINGVNPFDDGETWRM